MIDMTQIGINICNLRKSAGITQTGLADRLGVSFQAVSNWERGVSTPDISNLSELAKLFNVSIDEILSNKRSSSIVENLLKNRPISDIRIEEVEEIAPILHKEQTEMLISSADKESVTIESIAPIAPFISETKINEYAKKAYRENGINAVLPLAPFINTDVLNSMAIEELNEHGLAGIVPIAPFIDSGIMEEFLKGKI